MTVLIAGGGTGGHVFPMLAVGEALERVAGAKVFYVGTARGLEAKVMPKAGADLELLDVAPLRGGGARGFVRGGVKAALSLKAGVALVRRRKPDVVLSVGGYAGGPIALAARAMGVPLAVLEPNSVLGLTNRVLKPLATRAYVAFGDLDRRFAAGVAIQVGVPLRSAFAAVPYVPEAGRFQVLILGGSQGARGLNERVPQAMRAVFAGVPGLSVLHQAGRGRAEDTRWGYAQSGLLGSGHAEVTEFIDDVATELGRADVVIQRCGASSLAELCIVGRASVLVPFPFAADQHQLHNARSLEREGAAVALPEQEATPDRLAEVLIGLARDPARRTAMADRARALGRPRAAHDIAADLVAIASKGRG